MAPNERRDFYDHTEPSTTLPHHQQHTHAPSLSSLSLSPPRCPLSSGEQMGYGFVMFQYAEDAQAAIAGLHGRPLGHKTLHVSLAKQRNGASKRSSHPSTPISSFSPSSSLLHPSLSLSSSHTPPLLPPTPNTNVYMAGIPHHYSKAELDALTSPYGHILESRVLVDKATMTNRGIGFVRFERVDEAAAAILDLNGRIAPGGSEVMVVKLAVEKSQQGDAGRRDSLRGDSRAMTTLQAMKAQRSQTTGGDLYRGMDGGHRSALNVDDPIVSPRHGRQGSAQMSSASLGVFGRPPLLPTSIAPPPTTRRPTPSPRAHPRLPPPTASRPRR